MEKNFSERNIVFKKYDQIMINFKESYSLCSSLYNAQQAYIDLHNDGTTIENFEFHSDFMEDYHSNEVVSGNLFYHELAQKRIRENEDFTYPVVVPQNNQKFSKGILFFHGLNERSWDKYFVWAKYLAEKTNCPVIMFPIAYHINRCPKRWSDPRSMSEVAESRRKDVKSTTFVNAALSTRLEKHPEKFFISGLQSYYDVEKLATGIKNGEHPLFEKDTHLDIFSYSIGAFLSEIIILNNPRGMFSDSRLFMFCGGTTFDSMNGISKYIMDEKAFESLQAIRDKKVQRSMLKSLLSAKLSNLKHTWNGFSLMISAEKRQSRREKLLRKSGHKIFAVALEKDKVIPAEKVVETLKGKKGDLPVRVEIIDFPYPYTHEQPFPITNDQQQPLVNRCFTVVFDKAVEFFMGAL